MQRKKVIYVTAASPDETAADLRLLGLLEFGDSLRVVVPARHAAELALRAPIPANMLLRFTVASAAWLWARLIIFLGLSGENEIIVYSPPGQSRWLKLLSLALRGRVSFSSGEGNCVPFSLVGVLRAGWRRRFAAHGPICLMGSASADSLQKILADVRKRYPDAPVHGVLPVSLTESVDGLDSLETFPRWGLEAYARIARRCIGRERFQRIILPWTNDKSQFRWLGWWLPLWRIEIYNESLDAFPGRHMGQLLRHWRWQRVEYHRSLPVGVVGSASAFYLREILCDLRKRYPGVKLHAILPQSLEAPAQGMFDQVAVLRGGFFKSWLQAWGFLACGKRQVWVVPCTNEPYARMKTLAFLLPLGPRQIYNELADSFAARRLGTLYDHSMWRMRDRMPYQIVAGAAGENWIGRLEHLVLYSGRLLAGAGVLWRARLRSRLASAATPGARVDLILLDGHGDGREFLDSVRSVPPSLSNGSVRVVRVSRNGSLGDWDKAIRASDAEFVCLLDPECRMVPQDWLERLLSAFDDRTAQVGPELVSLDGETVVRGLLLETHGGLGWNFDNAVRWHLRPECLEVDALPRLCVVFRRRIFAETGFFAGDSRTMEGWADAEFSKRLRALGWRSVCNQSVTAAHPAIRLGVPVASQEVTEEIRR